MIKTVTQRFLSYITQETTSNPQSETYPSTATQLSFAKKLAEECVSMGLSHVTVDQHGYVCATLPATTQAPCPTLAFFAHMDTSPDASGENIKPNIIENYDGKEIFLQGISLSPDEFPSLRDSIGETIITTDGTTLLGADDKAGIAEILTAMDYLLSHPEIPHGEIKVVFTPDEEIGKGVDFFDVTKLGADFGYTMDGGSLGEIEYENFNAARANISIQGKSVHPGSAKNIMVNAALIAAELINEMPKQETPAHTEGYEGFFHLCHMEGNVSNASLSFIIRDFDTTSFENRKTFLRTLVAEKNKEYHNCIALDLYDEYQNMVSQIEKEMHIVDLALAAMKELHIKPIQKPIRGGTDGARLSFMGLPCPNLFAGGHNFHGPYEFIPVSSMEKAVDLIVKISTLAPRYLQK